MERIKKIPVIGYILRVLWAIIQLPKHLDLLYSGIEGIENPGKEIQRLKKLNRDRMKEIKELRQWNGDRMQEIAALQQWNEERVTEIARLHNGIKEIENLSKEIRRLKKLNRDSLKGIEELQQWNGDRIQEITALQQWNEERLQEIKSLQNLQVDADYIKKLKYLCSSLPTVWGEEDRLHISKLAAVDVCFFNTNSGHITIGDYTFAGSGVSILAGSHDVRLTGLLRRDVDMKEGFDIRIGNGVWLASNCVILGPAVIEDNAVIAAGAVVAPGTHVPAGAIYGGVPAKEIGRIDLSQDENGLSGAYYQAIQRTKGVLFTNGWTHKEKRRCGEITYIGHILFGKTAEVLVQKKKVEFLCYFEGYEECTLIIEGDYCAGYQHTLAEGENKVSVELDSGWNGKDICSIRFDILEDEIELFVAHIGGE